MEIEEGSNSSTSWAFPFVKLNGETYVIMDGRVPVVKNERRETNFHKNRGRCREESRKIKLNFTIKNQES